jgi:hypothetical protein
MSEMDDTLRHARRFADETTATIKESVRELATLLGGRAAIISIRTKYDVTIVIDVPINGDHQAFLLCAIETHASLERLLEIMTARIEAAKAATNV